MKPEGILLSEISQRDRKIPYNFIHMWNLKKKKTKEKQNKNKIIDTEIQWKGASGGVGRVSKRKEGVNGMMMYNN